MSLPFPSPTSRFINSCNSSQKNARKKNTTKVVAFGKCYILFDECGLVRGADKKEIIADMSAKGRENPCPLRKCDFLGEKKMLGHVLQ